MVFSRWRSRHRGAVLSGAPTPDAPGAQDDARGGGRQQQLADAHSAARGRPRDRLSLSVAPARALARTVRTCLDAVPFTLSRTPGKPPSRTAPGRLVRAESSDGGLCRDLCGVAGAAFGLATTLQILAGPAQAELRAA